MTTTPSVASLFADSTAKSYAGLPANTGAGALGEWPADGEHPCFVTKIDFKTDVFKAKNNLTVPAAYIQFHYSTSQIPANRKDPLDFMGVAFILPSDESQITDEGNKTRIRIEKERLIGHLQTITGTTVTDVRQGLQAALDLVTASRIEVLVKCSTRKDEKTGKTYKAEYLSANLSRVN